MQEHPRGVADQIGVDVSDGTCAVEDCERPIRTRRGWCERHYKRWWRYGDPTAGQVRGDDSARFWSKVILGDEPACAPELGACWLWQGKRSQSGHGQFAAYIGPYQQKWHYAHRWTYEQMVGYVPHGLQLDHLCMQPPCVNPYHLDPVTHLVNVQRGTSGDRQRARIRCPQGHPYDEANTIHERGRRVCRTCRRAKDRRRRAK